MKKDTVIEILDSYTEKLDNIISSLENTIHIHFDNICEEDKQLLSDKIALYTNISNKSDRYHNLVYLSLEKEDKIEIMRLSTLILELYRLVEEDFKDFQTFLKTGKSPDYEAKNTLH